MASTLRIDCEQSEIDTNNNETNSESYTIVYEFDVGRKIPLSIASSTMWREIPFIDLPSISFLKISSDQNLDVRLNGTTTALTKLRELVFKGLVTQIQLRNNSGSVAGITIEMYE